MEKCVKCHAFVFLLSLLTCVGLNSEAVAQYSKDFEKGKQLAELTNDKLKEASDLVTSVNNPGLLWTINDSGNEPEIFLIDKKLDIKLTVRLTGVPNRDWEGITIGPGPDPKLTYLYVGEIGDNDAKYPEKYIYILPEPKFDGKSNISVSDFHKLTFKLEDGPKDTESLFIDATTKNLYVVSKREFPVTLYELKAPHTSQSVVTASKVLTLPFAGIVAANRSLKEGHILMKDYAGIYYWENKNGLDVVSLLKQKPVEVEYEPEPQGESIAWAQDGSGFYTLSEKKKKKPSYLYYYSRKKGSQ